MKLSQQERAVFGKCEVCSAEHGQPCDTSKGSGPVDFGAHRRRVQLAPAEVPGQDREQTGNEFPGHYLEALDEVKRCSAEWPLQVRFNLMMSTALFMQAGFNAGIPYGVMGFPNMQSLLEIGGMTADEMEASRASIVQGIDDLLIPFFRDGKLPDIGGVNPIDVQTLLEKSGSSVSETLKGLREAEKAGTATEGEKQILALLAEGKELAMEMGGELVPLLLALDEKRWPGAVDVKAAITYGMQLTGFSFKLA